MNNEMDLRNWSEAWSWSLGKYLISHAGNIIFKWREARIVRHRFFQGVYREFRIRSNWNVVLNGILSSGTAEMWTESKELRYSDRGSNRSNRVTFDLRNGDHHHTLPLTLRWDRRFLYINSDYVKANKFRSQTILGRHFKIKIQCRRLDKLSLELLLKNL